MRCCKNSFDTEHGRRLHERQLSMAIATREQRIVAHHTPTVENSSIFHDKPLDVHCTDSVLLHLDDS